MQDEKEPSKVYMTDLPDKTKKKGGLLFAGRAFRHRNYRLFFTGQGLSLIGTWMQSIAMSWLVYRLTGSAGAPRPHRLRCHGSACSSSPTAAGVFVDRWDRRRLLFLTNLLAMIQATVLGVLTLTGHIAVWHIFVLGFCLGLVNAFDMPDPAVLRDRHGRAEGGSDQRHCPQFAPCSTAPGSLALPLPD